MIRCDITMLCFPTICSQKPIQITIPSGRPSSQSSTKTLAYSNISKPSTQCIGKLSGPKLMGNNCSNVSTVDLPSLSYIKTGIEGYKSKVSTNPSSSPLVTLSPTRRFLQHISLTSQNSLIYCLHIPHGEAGGEISVATANARISPLLAPSTTAVPRAVRSAQVPTG